MIGKTQIKLTLITLLFLVNTNTFGGNIHLVNFNKNQYQANHKNWGASQDEKGVMYFANDAGVLEYDGIEWKLNKLINNISVISVAAKSHDLIFSGGREEFGRWDRDVSGRLIYTSLSKLISEANLRNDDFWKIFITPENVYFQSFNSIYIYDYESVRRVNSDMAYLFLSQIGEDFWIQQMQGSLFRMNRGDSVFTHVPHSEIFWQKDVRIILPYQGDKLLIGTSNDGIYVYDGSDFQEWKNPFSVRIRTEDLNCGVYTSRNTYVWGTILNGVYETDEDGNILNHISSKNNLQNNTVLSVYEDHSQNIWVLLDKGISQIRYMNNLSSYTDYSGHIGSVYDARIWEDKLFLGTNQGVFYAPVRELTGSNSLSSMRFVNGTQGQTWSLFIDENRLIACNNKGLIEINRSLGTRDIYSMGTGVFQLKEINYKQKKLFFASTYLGVRVISKNNGTIFKSRMLDEPVKNIEIDHLDNIWIEHLFKGVYRCKIKKDFSEYQDIKLYGGENEGDTLPYKMKLFKVGGRIVLYGDNRYFIYEDTKDEIVPNEELDRSLGHIRDMVRIIHIDDIHYWGLAGNVIYKFTYDGLKASIYESYDLKANNFSMLEYDPNVSILNDSVNLICLDNGFLIYNEPAGGETGKKQKLETPYLVSFRVNDIDSNEKYIQWTENARIPYAFNTVQITYGANNTLSGDLFFQYKISGVDKDWSAPRQVNSVSYVRLTPGKYSLQIRSTNQAGDTSDRLTVSFEILHPWYQTSVAYILYSIGGAFIIFCIWYVIRRYYRKQHIKKIRIWESQQLKLQNLQLQDEIEKKNAELFTQTSFLIKKNEIILKLRDIVEDFYAKNRTRSLIPLQQSIHSYLNKNVNSDEDWEMFLIKFEEKHTAFFKKMKSLYPTLNKYDLRLCACLKLNLDTKEIASLMNLSVRGVESSRYRLRKKLNLEQSQSLNEFILTID